MNSVRSLFLRVLLLTALLAVALVGMNSATKAQAPSVPFVNILNFVQVASGLGTPTPNSPGGPVGIDFLLPTNQILVSVNFPTGTPNNFNVVNPNGTVGSYSTVSGLANEVKIATVREASGGFTVGDTFFSVPTTGEIVELPLGAPTPTHFATLPEAPGFSIYPYKDTTGVFGGNLIVASSSGAVYSIDSAGHVTTIVPLGTIVNKNTADPVLEGLTIVPNDAATYGPWAGTAIIVSEQDHGFYAVTPGGAVKFYNLGINLPEDIRIVPCNQNLYIADFADRAILCASATDLQHYVGHFIVDEEIAGGSSNIWDVVWNGTAFVKTLLAVVPQAEQMTFSPIGVSPVPGATQSVTGTVTGPGGVPLSGITVTLTNTATHAVVTTITGANGFYHFDNLLPGSYTVSVPALIVGPPRLRVAPPNPVSVLLNGCPATQAVDFAYNPAQDILTISGTAYCDHDLNGSLNVPPDVTEAGVTVTLRDSTNAVIGTFVTGADGKYHFDNLFPGTYTVTASPTTLPDGCTLASPVTLTINLTGPLNSTGNDFRYVPAGNGATRTWGFYKTHLAFIQSCLQAHPNAINLGVVTLAGGGTQDLTHPSISQIEAIFWTAPGQANTALGQARLELAHQLIAAEFNANCIGTSTASKGFSATLIADAIAALDGTNITLMNTLASQLDAFNNSGDNIGLASPLTEGKADPKGSQALAGNLPIAFN